MRIKRGVTSHQKHKKIIAQTKGMSLVRRSSVKAARQAILKALSYGYRDRRNKKRDFRALWITRINAALREENISYSNFMGKMKKAGVTIDRKILSELAVNQPSAFKAIVAEVKSAK